MTKISFLRFVIILLITFCWVKISVAGTDFISRSIASSVLIRGPYLQNVTPSGVTVLWETPIPTSSEILVNGRLIGDQEKSTVHKLTLNHLLSGQRYDYKIKDELETHSFITAFENNERPFKFVVWGDSQRLPENFVRVADAMLSFGPNFAVGVGDYVDNGGDFPQWDERFFSPGADFLASVPTFLAVGNHEYGYDENNEWIFTEDSSGLKNFLNFFQGPDGRKTYYSFDYGNSHFIVLDPNMNQSLSNFDIPPQSEQYQWLIDDLQSDASRCAAYRFVFFHEPAFVTTWDGGGMDGEAKLRDHLVPLLEQYKISIAFSGHAHVYERGVLNGVTYITTGGGGAHLDTELSRVWEHILVIKPIHHYIRVNVNNDRLEYSAVTPDGQLVDRDVLRPTNECQ